MTTRISKNLIKGKPFTVKSFEKALNEGGHSAFSVKFLNVKPVSVFASQQWFRLHRLITNGDVFETNLVHEHVFKSYSEMLRFLKENKDMIENLDLNILLYFEIKRSLQPKRISVGKVLKTIESELGEEAVKKEAHV